MISDQQVALTVYAAVLDCHDSSGQARAVVVKEYKKDRYQGDSESERAVSEPWNCLFKSVHALITTLQASWIQTVKAHYDCRL
jgi:hypothetical protein